MDSNITIHFHDTNIDKYIKNSENLVIKNVSYKINKNKNRDTNYIFNICIDSQEKIDILNKLFDFFIKCKCFFYEPDCLLFDIDKDLFYKSCYWFINSSEYWNNYPYMVFYCLVRTYNDNIVKYIEYMIDCGDNINIDMDLDLGIIDFLVSKCKSKLSRENYIKFIEGLIICINQQMYILMKNYGIKNFKCMCEHNIISLYLDYSRRENFIRQITYFSIETNQTEIIDYLLKYGLEKDEVKLDCEYELLISLIENDNEETFTYTIQNVGISNRLIQKMIKKSGEFITKEYIKILLNNGKLNLENLELLEKSIKNNPDKNLIKYVKKLILNEKN